MIERANNDLWKSQYLINPTSSRYFLNTDHQTPTVHGIDSRIVFLTLSDVLCVRCQYIGIHSRNVFLKRSGLILQKKIRKFAQNRQTDKQTDREFNYRGHSYPLWIVGGSGPITDNDCFFCIRIFSRDIFCRIQDFALRHRKPLKICQSFSKSGSESQIKICFVAPFLIEVCLKIETQTP